MYPMYSVVIPAFNAAATIAEAVHSVLAQSPAPAEVIVVDDGSTDDTAGIVRRLPGPIRLLQQANGGAGAATTAGMRQVGCPLMATLDADDLWLPHKLRQQLDFLTSHPHTAAVFTLARLFHDDPSSPLDTTPQRLWTRTTMLIRTDVALSMGAIVDPPGGRGEMVDWLAQCREAGYELQMVEEVLAMRRIRPGSLSFGRGERDAGYLHVARRALQRKKQLAARNAEGIPR